MDILAGDIGGTTVRLAAYGEHDGRLRETAASSFPSADYPALDEIVAAFLARLGGVPDRACLAVAGPVRGRTARLTNLPWIVDADAVARRFGFATVELINDLEAVAWGIDDLDGEQLAEVRAGHRPAVGNRAVIAAGTGLGEAGLYWDGLRYHPFACEGGHASFSPSTDVEWGLARALRRRHGYVSWERLVSGPGLVEIFRHLAERAGDRTALELVAGAEPAAAVSGAARSGHELARAALELFLGLYGAEAGNLALKLMATGGVFVAGGIAPKLAWAFGSGSFERGFLDKGRMRSLLETMPVHVILESRTALIGAGRRMVGEREVAR